MIYLESDGPPPETWKEYYEKLTPLQKKCWDEYGKQMAELHDRMVWEILIERCK